MDRAGRLKSVSPHDIQFGLSRYLLIGLYGTITPAPTPPSCARIGGAKCQASIRGSYTSTEGKFEIPSYPPIAHNLPKFDTRATLLRITFIGATYSHLQKNKIINSKYADMIQKILFQAVALVWRHEPAGPWLKDQLVRKNMTCWSLTEGPADPREKN